MVRRLSVMSHDPVVRRRSVMSHDPVVRRRSVRVIHSSQAQVSYKSIKS